jgi:hypothetical protein
MAKSGESSDLVKCSFCGTSQAHVGKLIAGPGVYICNECVNLCNEIIDEEGVKIVEAEGAKVTEDEGVDTGRPEGGPSSAEGERVVQARGAFISRQGRRPTVAELAAELGLDVEALTEFLRQATPEQTEPTDGPERPPVSVALQRIQQQLNELSARLADVVDRVERRDDP